MASVIPPPVEPVDDDLRALMRILARAAMRPKKSKPPPTTKEKPRSDDGHDLREIQRP